MKTMIVDFLNKYNADDRFSLLTKLSISNSHSRSLIEALILSYLSYVFDAH